MLDPRRFWTRRDFLKVAGRAGLIGAIPALDTAAALASDTIRISILHTTDLHGHILPTADYDGNGDFGGLARCATQIRKWREQNPNSILIDAGDIYQGTDVSLRNKGELMIDLFNQLQYDAWIIGNHEFDWGIETFANALQKSTMPVLAANTILEEKPAGGLQDSQHPFAKIQPLIVKEIAGVKVAIIGVTTPGMPFWLGPEFTRGIEVRHPVEPVRNAIRIAKREGADAIVLSGHMGLKSRLGGDDFANSVMALTTEFPETTVFVAGHTHQLIPTRLTNGVLLTQADHFGIHVGRVDLLFDRNSRKLLRRQATCELMDQRFEFDPIVISRAKSQLAESEAALSSSIGEVAETLHSRSRPGAPSDVERLIGEAIREALLERNVRVDGVMHGAFNDEGNVVAGRKTLQDMWKLIPFENNIVTAQLSTEELRAVMEEVFTTREKRNLLGFNVNIAGAGDDCRIVSMTFPDGRLLERGGKYLIAFNSFDARSGGHHFMKLRALLQKPEANYTLHAMQTRDALIGYFQRHKIVTRIAATNLQVAAA